MNRFFKFLTVAIFAAILAGCGEHVIINGISYRVMSQSEEKEMLSFARLTLLNSEQNLTPAQKNFILNTQPSIRISYTGNKSGRASYEWIINDEVMVRLNCEGEFLSSNMRVNARKVNLNETLKKGQKSGLQKLTLKEIKH